MTLFRQGPAVRKDWLPGLLQHLRLDTLNELRAAYQNAGRYTHINRFIDTYDLAK
jgi:hypothetical protein